MTNAATQAIISQLPTLVEPDAEEIDARAIKSALRMVERQQLLLYVARWLHDNSALLEVARFRIRREDEQHHLRNDEILTVLGGQMDEMAARGQVDDLLSELDERCNEEIQESTKRLVAVLNQVNWAMPEAWQELESLATTWTEAAAGPAWLARHRAAWEAETLSETTAPTGPGTNRPRM